MSKTIFLEDVEGKLHGYCERYWRNGELWWKGVMVNNEAYGYIEGHSVVGHSWTGYFFKGDKISRDNKEGCCYIWNRVVI